MTDLLTAADLDAIRQSDHDCNCPVCDDLVMLLVDTLLAERAHAAPVLAAAEAWHEATVNPKGDSAFIRATGALHDAIRAWRAARGG